ncbi:MAG: endonuclease MutS2 [Chloroflexota bacterium]
MDEKSLEILEFPKIREILAQFTSFSVARELLLSLKPVSDYELVTRWLGEVREARALLAEEPGFTAGDAIDIREPVALAARGKVLEPAVLVGIQRTLTSSRQVRASLSRRSQDFPRLCDIAQKITPQPQLEAAISRAITSDGEILDSASERLLGIKQGLRETRQRLLNRLDSLMRAPEMEKLLQETLITEREGRFVIPVKIEARREFKGIVHDLSNTGATAFVEPFETVEMGNELRELSLAEKREIERILAELSASVGVEAATISQNVASLASLELALAKARYADRVKATEPAILPPDKTGKDRSLYLNNARHPLLREKAVPVSLELGRDFSILVITGPNTGGKTVTLKTIGLLSLMALAGIPIPAEEGSVIPLFDNIFADIGDEQSIEQTLSSFSWHMGNIVRIIRGTTPRSLVLLDELGTSTDPDEGAALARAILFYFLSRGVMTAATTHFAELKAFAHTTPGMQNASLDFDPVTFAPTYHLTIGVPGGSNALAIASRLGLASEIIENARGMLSRGALELGKLISSLMAEKQNTEALRVELERAKGEAEAEKSAFELKQRELDEGGRRLLRETRDRLVRESAELERELKRIAAEVKRAKTLEAVESAKKSLTSVRRGIKEEDWAGGRFAGASGVTTAPDQISPGDTVWVIDTGLQGIVTGVSAKGKQLEIQAGNTRVRVGASSVQKVDAVPRTLSPEVSIVKTSPVARVGLELDLRGKRADAVESELDRYLNEASLAGLSQVRIIHGFGTGTVRQIVRDFLSSHPLVRSFHPGGEREGGDGVTIVQL